MVMRKMSKGQHSTTFFGVIILLLFCSAYGLPFGEYPEDRDDHFTFQNFKDFVLAGLNHIHDGTEDCRDDEVPEPSGSGPVAIAGSPADEADVIKLEPQQVDGDQNDVQQIGQAEDEAGDVDDTNQEAAGEQHEDPTDDLVVPHEHLQEEPLEPLDKPHEHQKEQFLDVIKSQEQLEEDVMVMRQENENGGRDVMVKEEI